jgi:hypothetical protein
MSLPALTALELERQLKIAEAAALKGICTKTFEERYGHLIRKFSPRVRRVKLRDLLEDQAA